MIFSATHRSDSSPSHRDCLLIEARAWTEPLVWHARTVGATAIPTSRSCQLSHSKVVVLPSEQERRPVRINARQPTGLRHRYPITNYQLLRRGLRRSREHFRWKPHRGFYERFRMPTKATIQRAKRDARQGKSASTQAGEFVHDEIRRIRQGKHGARSAKQAIAIGLSEARRSGVKLPPPKKGRTSAATRRKARRDTAVGESGKRRVPSRKRSRATTQALKRESRRAGSRRALSRQAKEAGSRRSPRSRSLASRKAAQTRHRRSMG
jgi:hypothetical protein